MQKRKSLATSTLKRNAMSFQRIVNQNGLDENVKQLRFVTVKQADEIVDFEYRNAYREIHNRYRDDLSHVTIRTDVFDDIPKSLPKKLKTQFGVDELIELHKKEGVIGNVVPEDKLDLAIQITHAEAKRDFLRRYHEELVDSEGRTGVEILTEAEEAMFALCRENKVPCRIKLTY
jgi:hypothetical protein